MHRSNLSPLALVASSALLAGLHVSACSSSDSNKSTGTTPDGGSSLDGGGGGNDSGGGGGNDSGGGGNDSGADAGDAGGDSGLGPPTDPNNARAITAGQIVSGSVAAGTDTAHYYKYVPGTAFTSVSANVSTLGPAGSFGDLRWQLDTNVGLCDATGALKCCPAAAGPSACFFRIREGSSGAYLPVVVGKTYYVIVAGSPSSATDYAFALVENP